jgi:hypothetical protein
MNITIKACNNSLRFTSSVSVGKDWEERFLSKENQAKILAWCKDHHVRAYWNSVDKKSELIQDLTEANVTSFGLLNKLHTEFMLFVGELPSNKHCSEKSEVSEKNKKFVHKLLNEWDETETRMGTAGAIIMGKDSEHKFVAPCGHISSQLLKQLLEAWLQVYDK